jgi:hypothetical protein
MEYTPGRRLIAVEFLTTNSRTFIATVIAMESATVGILKGNAIDENPRKEIIIHINNRSYYEIVKVFLDAHYRKPPAPRFHGRTYDFLF